LGTKIGEVVVAAVLVALVVSASAAAATAQVSHEDLFGMKVAILESYNAETCNESRTALLSMFTWMNASVDIIDKDDIIAGKLWGYEVLSIPEGLGPSIEYYLGNDAIGEIKNWVAAGGSYVGVRGSAAIAVNKSYYEGLRTTFKLGLVNGTSSEVQGLGDFKVVDIVLNQQIPGLDLSAFGENITMLFETGRSFVADEGQEMVVVGNYSDNGLPAIIAANYGQGNCFLSSPHFEYEEDSDRDGTDYLDEYDDPTSEWPFVLKMVRWLVDTSATVVTTQFSVPVELLVLGLGGAGVAVLVAATIMKRK